MVIRVERTVWRDLYPSADPDGAHIGGQLAARLNVGVIADDYRAARSCLKDCVAVDMNSGPEFDDAAAVVLVEEYLVAYEYLGVQPEIRVVEGCAGRNIAPVAHGRQRQSAVERRPEQTGQRACNTADRPFARKPHPETRPDPFNPIFLHRRNNPLIQCRTDVPPQYNLD